MNLSLSNPFMSVVIRSYNRLNCVLELIERSLNQDYKNYEIVVVDQSSDTHWIEYKQAFELIDHKVRLIRTKPRGSAAARNLGVAVSRGDVVLLMDDDDLPVRDDWISSHARNYNDPFCVGVSGKCLKRIDEQTPYKNKQLAYKLCLTYSFFLRGKDFTGIDEVKKPVQWLHGLNASIRRSYVMRLGGWYPYINNFDEHSFCFKLQKVMKPHEYLMFDPKPVVLRRFDIPGGLGKRQLPLPKLLENQLIYYHRVVAKHYPIRFYSLYPIFMLYAFKYIISWFRGFSYYTDSIWFKWFEKKNALRLYFLQEFIKYPFLVIRVLFMKRPKWEGPLIIPKEIYHEYSKENLI